MIGGWASVMQARSESPRANRATRGLRIRVTRARTPRQLPTDHGHAARPLRSIRADPGDALSKPPHWSGTTASSGTWTRNLPYRALRTAHGDEKRLRDGPSISGAVYTIIPQHGWEKAYEKILTLCRLCVRVCPLKVVFDGPGVIIRLLLPLATFVHALFSSRSSWDKLGQRGHWCFLSIGKRRTEVQDPFPVERVTTEVRAR